MNTPVPVELVTQTWQEISTMGAEDVHPLIEQMRDEQPALLAFLLAVDAYPISREEQELVVYLGVVVWQMMRRWHKRLMRVSVKKLEQAEKRNMDQLELMGEDTEGDFMSATLAILETYPEPEVLRYIVEALMEPEPDEIELSDEGIGTAFLHLKTALDALIMRRGK